MTAVATCLRDIDKVRQVAAGAEQAYVARSRLARLILRVTNLARSVSDPSIEAGRQGETSQELARILDTCERLDACRRSATHASEPLDERWRIMWQEILAHLAILQELLEGKNAVRSAR